MIFKVVRDLDKRVMFQTKVASCVPDDTVIRQMNSAGYKTYMDGKLYRPKTKRASTVKDDGQVCMF